MDENKKSVDGVLENLALLTDGLQTLFPEGKMICLYELNNEDFRKVQSNFRKIDNDHKRFSIDISGVEHVFVHEDFEYKTLEITQPEIKTENKPNLITKILSRFKRS